jgi:hypothetical protein
MQSKEGVYLSSFASTFGMKHSSYLFLSTFLKPCVSRLLKALCYSSSGALLSSGDGVTGNEVREVGKREIFWGKGKS